MTKNVETESKKRELMKTYIALVILGEKERADEVLSDIFKI